MTIDINVVLIVGAIIYGVTYTETVIMKFFVATKIMNNKGLSVEKTRLITEMVSKHIRIKDLLKFLH